MEHFPVSVVVLIGLFSSCFKANNFIYFQGFMLSYMLLGQTRKCVTHITKVCFFVDRHVTSMERFLSKTTWDLPGVRERLVNVIQDKFRDNLMVHGSYLGWIDTYLVSKVKGKMPGVQNWHDHSSNPDRTDRLIGHHWAICGLIGFGMSAGSLIPTCFPLLVNLISGQINPLGFVVDPLGNAQLMSIWDTVCPMIANLKGMLGNQPLRMVADAYFSKSPFINWMLTIDTHVISRMRKDAVGWDDPEPVPLNPKRRGRKRKKPLKGKKWKLISWMKIFPLETVTVSIYGKIEQVQLVCRDLWITGVESQKVRIVVVERDHKPVILVSTDLMLTPTQIIEIYGRRFNCEMVIRDLKQYFGIGDYQCTGFGSMIRYATLSIIGFCVWRISAMENQGDWLSDQEKTTPLSFRRISRSLRGFVLTRIFQKSALGKDLQNSKALPDEILNMIV